MRIFYLDIPIIIYNRIKFTFSGKRAWNLGYTYQLDVVIKEK